MTPGKCIQADAGQGWAVSNASWALDGHICKHWPSGVGNITSQARSCWGKEGDRGAGWGGDNTAKGKWEDTPTSCQFYSPNVLTVWKDPRKRTEG